MDLREIVAPTMKELFIKEIEKKILSGEWKIGQRLPTEREMERITKVSRTIINSGLSELAQNGFVEIIPRKGVFVGDYIRNGQLNTLLSIMSFNGGKLDKKTFDSLMTYRMNTDCECTYLSSLNRTDDDIKLMRNLYDKLLKATVPINKTEILKLKFEFQHALYCSTGNNIYPLVCNAFKQLSTAFNEIIFRHFGYDLAPLHIPELIDAIEEKDAENARHIMSKLIDTRIYELRQVYFKDN